VRRHAGVDTAKVLAFSVLGLGTRVAKTPYAEVKKAIAKYPPKKK
jgi:hypothetical protein